jgi:hypothetical protein
MDGEASIDTGADVPVDAGTEIPVVNPSSEISPTVDLSISANPFKGFLPLIFSLSGEEAPMEAEEDGDWTYACP